MKRIIFGASLIGLLFIGCGSKENNTEVSEETKQLVWIDKGKEAIKGNLKDPKSAEFRNVYFSKSGGVPMTCGEVNSKNGFGGFVGFQKFVSAGNPELTYLQEQVSDFEVMWDKFCQQNKN